MQRTKYTIQLPTDKEIVDALVKATPATVDVAYKIISVNRGVSKLDSQETHSYEYDARKKIILTAFKENTRTVVTYPIPPNEIDLKLIIDLSLNHKMNAENIAKYIAVSKGGIEKIVKQKLDEFKVFRDFTGVIEKKGEIDNEPEANYINLDKSYDAYKFAMWMSHLRDYKQSKLVSLKEYKKG